MWIGFQSEYANLSVYGEILSYMEIINEKKDKTDQGTEEWRNGGMAEWLNGGMVEWRNGGMAEWRNG